MTVSRIPLLHSADSLSRLIVGVWRLADVPERTRTADVHQLIDTCLAAGITTFDHADIYGGYVCEEIFGRALAEKPDLRGRMELVSKCGIKLVSPNRPTHRIKSYDTGKKHILLSVENSLGNLRTDYLDMLLIHRPDPLLDADEVASAFTELKTLGKVKHFGVSNFTPRQFDLLQARLDFPLQTNQIEISVLETKALYDGTLDQCQQYRVAPMAWSPFAGGKLFQQQNERADRVRTELQQIGEELGGATIEQVAIAWLLRLPANVIPVLGSGRPERIKDLLPAQRLKLSREQWFRILQASEGKEVA